MLAFQDKYATVLILQVHNAFSSELVSGYHLYLMIFCNYFETVYIVLINSHSFISSVIFIKYFLLHISVLGAVGNTTVKVTWILPSKNSECRKWFVLQALSNKYLPGHFLN